MISVYKDFLSKAIDDTDNLRKSEQLIKPKMKTITPDTINIQIPQTLKELPVMTDRSHKIPQKIKDKYDHIIRNKKVDSILGKIKDQPLKKMKK